MSRLNNKIREITIIAIGVSIIIGGGFAIIMFSAFFPVPGLKFILMSPFLSTVIYVIQRRVDSKSTLIKLGIVFAFIMTTINFYMGIAILMTTLITHISTVWIKDFEKRVFWGSALFSGYTGVFALEITKVFIGGPVRDMSNRWILIIGLICTLFGIMGNYLAKRVLKNIRISTPRVE